MDRATYRNVGMVTLPPVSATTSSQKLMASSPSTLAYVEIIICTPAANTGPIYIGDSSVTAANGIEIPANSERRYHMGDPSKLYVITASGTQNVRIAYI